MLKCLRSNNGGEYTSNRFENLSRHAIRHQLATPLTQQTGVVDRTYHIITEKLDACYSLLN